MTPKEMYDYLTQVTDRNDPRVQEDIRKGIREPVGVTDIHEHLFTLHASAKGNVLEIGVRHGASTCALLSGIENHGGHVYSIDIENCYLMFKGHPQWTFIQEDSKNVDKIFPFLPGQFNLLFIDGDHTFEGVYSDLMNYGCLAKIIMCHDFNPAENPGVVDAVKQYTQLRGLDCVIRIRKPRASDPVMKILVAVMACASPGCRKVQDLSRQTWVKNVSNLGDFKFFVGRSVQNVEPDEEMVDASDAKEYILWKTVEILKYMLVRDYDMILKIDNDTYLNIDQLTKQDYSGYDYVGAEVGTLGKKYGDTEAWSFIQGSAQYLSRKAAKIIVDEVISTTREVMPGFQKYNGTICPYLHSEDLWIGQVLAPRIRTGEIKALADQRFTNGPLTYHFALDKQCYDLSKWFSRLDSLYPDSNEMTGFHEKRKVECVF